jgi:hypothetical protein
MDTITLIRSAIRGLLTTVGAEPAAALRAMITSGDDYTSTAKPHIDWDEETAREQLIDSRTRDGSAMPAVADGLELDERAGKGRATAGQACSARTSPTTVTACSASPAESPPIAPPAG